MINIRLRACQAKRMAKGGAPGLERRMLSDGNGRSDGRDMTEYDQKTTEYDESTWLKFHDIVI